MKYTDYNVRALNAINPACQVGVVGKLFGNNGQLIVKIWDNFPENYYTEPLWVEIDSLAVPLFVASLKEQGTAKAVVSFEEFQNEKRAAMLVGKAIFSEKPEVDEDANPLIGLEIFDQTSSTKGVITDFFDSEHNPLMEITIEGEPEPALVPLAEEFIVKIDKKRKLITLNLPEGIFEL